MSNKESYRQGLGFALRLGTEMTVATLIGASMGYALDYYFDSSPIFLSLGLFFGVAAGFKGIYQAIASLEKESDDGKESDDKDPE